MTRQPVSAVSLRTDPPFQAAVDAGLLSVMCSYNRVKLGDQPEALYGCENDRTLKQDLKGTMGFGGFVLSDWGATKSTGAVPAPGNFYVNLPPLFLGHFSPIFARFFAVFSPFSPSCRQDSGNRHQDPEKRSETVEKRRVKNPKLT